MIQFFKRARFFILLVILAGALPQLGGCLVRDRDDDHHEHDHDFHDHDDHHDRDWH